MSGLRRICRYYGRIVVRHNGRSTRYVWDDANDKPVSENDMDGIEIRRTHHSLLPWRLYAEGKPVPYASCRTKRGADELKTRLEEVADWSQIDTWDEDTFVAVRAILTDTDSRRLNPFQSRDWN